MKITEIKKKAIKEVGKFGLTGVICFIVDYGLLLVLTELAGLNYLISNAISFTVSTIFNYELSVKFVFENNIETKKQKQIAFVGFLILSVIGLGLNQLFMWILPFHYTLSKIFTTGIVMIYNYFTRKMLLKKAEAYGKH